MEYREHLENPFSSGSKMDDRNNQQSSDSTSCRRDIGNGVLPESSGAPRTSANNRACEHCGTGRLPVREYTAAQTIWDMFLFGSALFQTINFLSSLSLLGLYLFGDRVPKRIDAQKPPP